jgi:putative DNA primase/helicase
VLLDEADSLTPDAQLALRALIEFCASNCGFILTANDASKIIPALHSRCSVIDFIAAPELQEDYLNRACQILRQEGVEHDRRDVAEYVRKYFPDFRRTLNELQANAIRGRLQPISQITLGHSVNGARVDIEHGVGDRGFGQQDGDDADDGATPDPAAPLIREPSPPLAALLFPPSELALLLDGLTAAFKRFNVLPNGAAEAMALWVLFDHSHDAARHSPILAVLSPEKRCGKTTLLDVLSRLTTRPLATSNITPAALYWIVHEVAPTLLIDEGDTFLSTHSSLRGILNSGHTRATAWVMRMDNGRLRAFCMWSPKVIAIIGNLPDTVADRSIIIRLKRKRSDEMVERLGPNNEDDLRDLRRRAGMFAAENLERLKVADPIIPPGLDDRAADNWRMLLAIADAAGGHWPGLARKVAVMLSGNARGDESPGVTMLGDIHKVRDKRRIDRIRTTDLITALTAMEDRPWSEWNEGGPITGSQLARLLKPFQIGPTTIRIGTETAKGYWFSDFDDAFARYLPLGVTP